MKLCLKSISMYLVRKIIYYMLVFFCDFITHVSPTKYPNDTIICGGPLNKVIKFQIAEKTFWSKQRLTFTKTQTAKSTICRVLCFVNIVYDFQFGMSDTSVMPSVIFIVLNKLTPYFVRNSVWPASLRRWSFLTGDTWRLIDFFTDRSH